jgi:hypothetical protein
MGQERHQASRLGVKAATASESSQVTITAASAVPTKAEAYNRLRYVER